MKKTIIYILLLLLIFVVYRLYIELYYLDEIKEYMINIPKIVNPSWIRSNQCGTKMSSTIHKSLDEKNINEANNSNRSNLIFPCEYNDIDDEINKLPNDNNKIYFIIDGADQITAKNGLWINLVQYHGREKAKELSPSTYILNDNDDIKLMLNEHRNDKAYIMKKNIQRQQGLKITNDLNEIVNNRNEYVIAQELLRNPYLVNDRKINLRVYVLVVCYKNNMDVYMYDDGFMYYTKQDFNKNDLSDDNNITTGYVERDIYEKNPLTHKDFQRYLDMNEGIRYHKNSKLPRKLTISEVEIRKNGYKISEVVFHRIKKLLKDIFIVFKGKICNSGKLFNNYSAQLFGADVSISDQLEPHIMEVNKGPDLGPKDEKDEVIKKSMVSDAFDILGLVSNNSNNGFIQILEI